MTFVCMVASSCASQDNDVIQPHHQFYWSMDWALGFDIPSDWTASKNQGAIVFSGKKKTPDFFTTLTMQAFASNVSTLEQALTEAYAPLETSKDFVWYFKDPVPIKKQYGMAFFLQVELHESMRMAQGLILSRGNRFLTLVYTAIPEYFPLNLSVYENAVDTLVFGLLKEKNDQVPGFFNTKSTGI